MVPCTSRRTNAMTQNVFLFSVSQGVCLYRDPRQYHAERFSSEFGDGFKSRGRNLEELCVISMRGHSLDERRTTTTVSCPLTCRACCAAQSFGTTSAGLPQAS